MAIKIYRKNDTNSVYVAHGILGTFPFNTLRAVSDLENGTIDIINNSKICSCTSDGLFREAKNVNYTDFQNENGIALGDSVTSTTLALNNIFENLPLVESAPTISSSLAISVADGDFFNYFLDVEAGTSVSWSNLPSGIVSTAYKNNTELLGIIQDGVGTYNVSVQAINPYGVTLETLVITVTSDFVNAKSIIFNNTEYMNATANSSNPLYRAANGSGAGDAWTISLWFKRGTSTNAEQPILYFGGNDKNTEGRIELCYDGRDKKIHLKYGTDSSYILLETPDDSISNNIWHHIFITYDGGTTGADAGSINSYYGRFEIWIDGVSKSLSKSNSNNGYSGSILPDLFRIGRLGDESVYMRNNCKIDELAIWGSDRSSAVASIYSGGSPGDLSELATPPNHWWRMGDGDTFPTIEDNVASLDFTMINMVVTDIINDAP